MFPVVISIVVVSSAASKTLILGLTENYDLPNICDAEQPGVAWAGMGVRSDPDSSRHVQPLGCHHTEVLQDRSEQRAGQLALVQVLLFCGLLVQLPIAGKAPACSNL